MPPSGVDYASEFLNGYAPEYVAIQNNSVTLSSVIIAIFVCNSLYFSTIKIQQISLITKFTSTYNSSNSR